jgi:gluconate 5-dehydrogenase
MSTELFDLTGKTALVTGGTHGIGMAIATGLARAGAGIIVNDRFPEKLEAAGREYAEQGIQAHTFVLDVTDEEAVERTIPVVEEEAGPIDILVNNAGIIKRIPILDMKAEEYRQVLDVDLTGPFIMAKAVARGMIERGHGKIINMCSMMSELGRNTVSAYAAAKGGLKMLTRNMATEWARHNIQINGIGPGYIATVQTEPIRVDGHPFNDFIIQRTPAGRWGEPEDLVGAAIFLASKASDFVNGHILYVDGGILATIGRPANEE